MLERTCKLLIIGAGPGGYACAIRAGQLGIDTIVVEASKPGGTCLNVGCIPSKALIHAADEFERLQGFTTDNPFGILTKAPKIDLTQTMQWKEGIIAKLTGGVSGLIKKAGAEYVQGHATIRDGKTVDVETPEGLVCIRCEALVIATGSHPVELATLPFGGKVMSSTEALSLTKPPKRLTVIGGGYIGLEIGTALAKLGTAVTVLEAADRILPQYDAALSAPVVARLKSLDVEVHLSTRAKHITEDGKSLVVEKDATQFEIPYDKILVAIGRAPTLQGFGLENLHLDMAGGFIAVDAHCATSMRGVHAIGDVTGDPMLAHRAMAQGTLVAEVTAGGKHQWDKRAIPAVCFTDPEIVSVGALPEEIPGSKAIMLPFSGNGRAMTLARSDGFVRLIIDPDSSLVLGLQATGEGVSEFAGQFALALEMGATTTDIADTIHAHPTLGETVQESALKSLGRALHA